MLRSVTKQQTNDDPWGLAIPSVAIEALHAAGTMSHGKMREPGTMTYNGSLNGYIDACRANSAFLWLSTPTNDRLDARNITLFANCKFKSVGMLHPARMSAMRAATAEF